MWEGLQRSVGNGDVRKQGLPINPSETAIFMGWIAPGQSQEISAGEREKCGANREDVVSRWARSRWGSGSLGHRRGPLLR